MCEQMVTLLMENGPGNMDVKAFIMQGSNDFPPRIRVAYEVTDYGGEEIDSGIEGPDEGYTMLPDEVELAEGVNEVAKAVDFLVGHYAYEASASFFHPGVWYEAAPDENPYVRFVRTPEGEKKVGGGTKTRRSFHLKGFSQEQEEEVWKKIQDIRKRH